MLVQLGKLDQCPDAARFSTGRVPLVVPYGLAAAPITVAADEARQTPHGLSAVVAGRIGAPGQLVLLFGRAQASAQLIPASQP